MESVNICHLYPDNFNLYGDSGNIEVMKKRLEWRGIHVNLQKCDIGERLDWEQHDLFFVGSGVLSKQYEVVRDFNEKKAASVSDAITDGFPMLAIGGGYQLLGKDCVTFDHKVLGLYGVCDFHVKEFLKREKGDLVCQNADGVLVGYENHNSCIYHGQGVKPYAKVLHGFGNNGEDKTEGIRYKNLIGTNFHGPFLANNPQVADELLLCALKRKYGVMELLNLDDRYAEEHRKMLLRRYRILP